MPFTLCDDTILRVRPLCDWGGPLKCHVCLEVRRTAHLYSFSRILHPSVYNCGTTRGIILLSCTNGTFTGESPADQNGIGLFIIHDQILSIFVSGREVYWLSVLLIYTSKLTDTGI